MAYTFFRNLFKLFLISFFKMEKHNYPITFMYNREGTLVEWKTIIKSGKRDFEIRTGYIKFNDKIDVPDEDGLAEIVSAYLNGDDVSGIQISG